MGAGPAKSVVAVDKRCSSGTIRKILDKVLVSESSDNGDDATIFNL